MILLCVSNVVLALVIAVYAGKNAALKFDLEAYRRRVVALENILCPDGQHAWVADYEGDCRVCRKCGKMEELTDGAEF